MALVLEAAGGIEPPNKGFADRNETPVRYGNFHVCALIAPFHEVFHVVLNCMFFVFIPARSRQRNHCILLRFIAHHPTQRVVWTYGEHLDEILCPNIVYEHHVLHILYPDASLHISCFAHV